MLPEIRVGWLYIGFMEWILLCIIVLIVLSFAFLISAPNPASSSSIGPIDESGAEKPVKRKTGFYEIVVFCYSCLLKPHRGDGNRNQQDALESFYNAQASIYDATRVRLLQGREDMLALAIAQIRQRLALGALTSKPVWVDVCLIPQPLHSVLTKLLLTRLGIALLPFTVHCLVTNCVHST